MHARFFQILYQCLKCERTVTDGVQALLGPVPENFSGKLVYLVPPDVRF